MAGILRLYVIREVITPTVMALITITMILVVREIYKLVDMIMQPGVGAGQVLRLFGSLLPSVMIFCAPMAVLAGVIIGIGRMAMDREILAMRASGINLLSVFAPALALAFASSIVLLYLSASFVPRSLTGMISQVAQLSRVVITSLEPGRFHDSGKIGLGKDDFVLYFREHEPDRQGMRGIVMKTEDYSLLDADADQIERGSRSTAPVRIEPRMFPPNMAETGESRVVAEGLIRRGRDRDLTMIFANRGRIETGIDETDQDGVKRLSLLMTLEDGSMHMRTADSREPFYVVYRFDEARLYRVREQALERGVRTLTNAQLRAQLDTWGGRALREIVERYARGFAFFVFALVGVPLAIHTRIGGRSWAILLAIVLLLVYFVLTQFGLTLIDQKRTLAGIAMACLPNLLFTGVGIALWWHTLRS